MTPQLRIQSLNDMLRTTFIGGRVVTTEGLRAQGEEFVEQAFSAVRNFTEFSEENDPHGEHDFGAFDIGETTVFWKIDYYDRDMEGGSDNPADPAVTCRVLTIFLASEY